MPRAEDIPECPGAPQNRLPKRVTQEYAIQIVTPMFGGGVTPGFADDRIPIRETAIRGHLRHWWRLIIGHKLGDRMWQREEEVFGSTEFPSPLTVQVVEQPRRVEQVDPEYGDKFGPIAYALFSAIENKQQVAKDGLRFRLFLGWDEPELLRMRRKAQNIQRKRDKKPLLPDVIEDIADEIDVSLRAWIAFGGLGARTRRGCGAVHCQVLVGDLPALPAKVLIGPPKSDALEAWKETVNVYREFRQTPRGEKHQKTLRNGRTVRVPGRSHWPEADSIRQISGCALKLNPGSIPSAVPADQNSNDHSTSVVPEKLLPAFPKAILGLPINFHFADGPGKNRPGRANEDPQDVQLIPLLQNQSDALEKANRLASPVITRPLWFNEKWYPAVVVLNQPIPEGFQVRLEGKQALAGGADLSRDLPIKHIVGAALGELRPMRGKPSALEALVEFLTKERHFKEVTR